MPKWLVRLSTIRTLGLVNVARVALYRIGIRSKIHPVLRLSAEVPTGPFLESSPPDRPKAIPSTSWRDRSLYFSRHTFPLNSDGSPPDWHVNPFQSGARISNDHSWSEIPDFDPNAGDIKGVWEASRFDWLVAMAERASLGDHSELDRLNLWLADWANNNKPYLGVNWKCGQEASIRIMHMATAALILGQVESSSVGMRSLVSLHLQRIAPTMNYAIGQANNHGTSEAAALFIGGSWLGGSQGYKWAELGRRWLEDRAKVLVGQDGSFSQYSVVYHRMMLDTYSLCEVWRRTFELPPFSDQLNKRLCAAVDWLYTMADPATGNAPNMGANDGARLMPLTDTDFRDFRPTLQLAAALFLGKRAIADHGQWDQPATWLGVPPVTDAMPSATSVSFEDGGYHVMSVDSAKVVLRYPHFRFRPSQADALHVDLWVKGRNILRDAGTYSYSSFEGEWFAGTAAHNTVEFDQRNQMPRLGRFLFGSWLRAEDVMKVSECNEGFQAAAGYTDDHGAKHHRSVTITSTSLTCIDRIGGAFTSACLRWRLAPDEWKLEGRRLLGGDVEMEVITDNEDIGLQLNNGWESLYYQHREQIPVLEIVTKTPINLITKFSF